MYDVFNLSFPGNETFSTILSCVVVIFCELAIFYLILLYLKWWVPGRSYHYAVFGRFIGVLLSIVITARVLTATFTRYFALDQNATSAVLVVFIILSLALAFRVYARPSGGNHGPDPQNSQRT